jgi:polar amino acid transport system substrate-binding protein
MDISGGAFSGRRRKLLTVMSPRQLERAEPFRNPVISGRSFLDHGGFGFRPGDAELRKVVNRHLLDLPRSPGYLALIEPFGFTSADLPDRTTAERCAQ